MATYQDPDEALVIRAVNTTPIIDNHAHPLLKPSAIRKHELLTIATEAQNDALPASITGLAHHRAVRQLSAVLGCEPTWDAVKSALESRWMSKETHQAWERRCLQGIQCVLVDDLISDPSALQGFSYFDQFTASQSKRIVRIETVLAEFIGAYCRSWGSAKEAFEAVLDSFKRTIRASLKDSEVVGFKSVICYRTGLAIPKEIDEELAKDTFGEIFQQQKEADATEFTRLDHPGLNEYFVHVLASIIRDHKGWKKPIQFHTGLGDNDMTLSKSSPAHLQDFIRTYPTVPIVLLHSSYPYTREAGYLAAMYVNVYADIGEVFPFLSRDGQESVVREILELCPSSKILWSTDGHYFPETYFLAVEQMREVFGTVLCEYVRKKDLSAKQAVNVVEDVLFNNSNKLYQLGLPMTPQRVSADQSAGAESDLQALLSRKLSGKAQPKFMRVYWVDMTSMVKGRVIPMRRVKELVKTPEDFRFGVTKVAMGLLQNDTPVPGLSPAGEWRLHPDLSTLVSGPREGHVTAMGVFKNKDGSPVELCPRTLLVQTLQRLESKQDLTFDLGFEIELILLDGEAPASAGWASVKPLEHRIVSSVIEEAVERLDEAGIYVEMVHCESADRQFEIILPKAPALRAVDTLILARDIISTTATAHGYRMTLYPKWHPMQCGTAAHMHMSISSAAGSNQTVYEAFYAGVLERLAAIAGFTLANGASYQRMVDGVWAGGTYIAWGSENRETPLRKIEGSHWEVRCMDGFANPYLAVAAIVLAGAYGVARQLKLSQKDCVEDPSIWTGKEQAAHGIVQSMPRSLGESLKALEADAVLHRAMGEELVERYIAVKRVEDEMLSKMGEEERKMFLACRY